jgi:branched-chain amino acid transport system substrate-binding protein
MAHRHDHESKHGLVILSRRTLLQTTALGAGWMLLGRAGETLAQAAPSEIRIGVTASLSGIYQGGYGIFAKLNEAWANHVNQRGGIFLKSYNKALPIKLVQYDDKSDQPTVKSMYERLATVDKVDLFLGPFSSGLHNPALQASIAHKIPFFMVEANDGFLFETPNPWQATGLRPAASEYTRLVEFYQKLGGVQSFAIINRDNVHETPSANGLADLVTKAGHKVVFRVTAPPDTKDFSSIILKMKDQNPEVVVVEALAPPWNIQFLKQARELGLNPKEVVVGHAPLPVLKGLGEASQNLVSMNYSFDGDSPDHKEFAQLCKDAGFEPWQYSEAGIRYRAYKRIEDALKRAGSVNKEAVRAAMRSTDLPLFGEERMRHDERGYGTDMPYPTQAKAGRYESLWPIAKGLKIHEFKAGKW